jgi:radical SAM protein with 4Fe4S-binding SPASM domain
MGWLNKASIEKTPLENMKKRFKKVYIEITNCCNLACTFCPGTVRKQGFMRVDQFEAVLKKLRGFTDYLYLHVMGEPLLHPDLAQILSLCFQYDYKVNITTNGTLIKAVADELLDAKALRQINFSLHSQEGMTGQSTLEQYLEDIFCFTQRALDKGGIYISYRLWNLTSQSSGQFNSYVAKKLQERFEPGFSVYEALKSETRITLGESLYLNSAEVFEWPCESANGPGNGVSSSSGSSSDGSLESGGTGFCQGLRDQAAILVDGTVVPCCLDSDGRMPLGNIFCEDFEAILQSDRAKAIYDGFSKRLAVEDLCTKCTYKNRFLSKHP